MNIFLLVILIGVIAVVLVVTLTKRKTESMRQDELGRYPYEHSWKGYSIALDPQNKELHLGSRFGKDYRKGVYPFSDIRSWRFNIATGGYIVGGEPSLRRGMLNHQTLKENESQTGLFISVKDIKYPEWQIRFPDKNLELELKRWMEILEQEINETVV